VSPAVVPGLSPELEPALSASGQSTSTIFSRDLLSRECFRKGAYGRTRAEFEELNLVRGNLEGRRFLPQSSKEGISPVVPGVLIGVGVATLAARLAEQDPISS